MQDRGPFDEVPDLPPQPREKERRAFIDTEIARLRQRSPFFAEQALDEIVGIGEREAFLQLVQNVPLPEVVTMTDLHVALRRTREADFYLGLLDARLVQYWEEYANTIGGLVADRTRHPWVRRWFYLALVLADTRLRHLH